MWIDTDQCDDIETGYLVKTLDLNTGCECYSLQRCPLQTNLSHETRLRGWCGAYNNQSEFAKGVARVVRRLKRRTLVALVTGEALRAFLDADGYPELKPSI